MTDGLNNKLLVLFSHHDLNNKLLPDIWIANRIKVCYSDISVIQIPTVAATMFRTRPLWQKNVKGGGFESHQSISFVTRQNKDIDWRRVIGHTNSVTFRPKFAIMKRYHGWQGSAQNTETCQGWPVVDPTSYIGPR